MAAAWQDATRRTRRPPGRRPDTARYLDEAHHFLHLPYPLEMLLAEARGYRLSLTLAHQYLSQLPHDLEEALSANARTKTFFNVSPEDAHRLARHTAPRLDEYDLSRLGRFHAAVRPVRNGAETPAYTLRTEPCPTPPRPRPRPHRPAGARAPARRTRQGPRHHPGRPPPCSMTFFFAGGILTMATAPLPQRALRSHFSDARNGKPLPRPAEVP
ncbi:TraM recognition domain-containing protein [Streptomyces rimosus]|uniref:TraM recognition domain-containing protein n=1 Tax=Streptomyces rimosus TaxID=1927 RepID=UPI0004C92B65|nr:TraM recognition domain-containing protein [Streptomyces rimosus]